MNISIALEQQAGALAADLRIGDVVGVRRGLLSVKLARTAQRANLWGTVVDVATEGGNVSVTVRGRNGGAVIVADASAPVAAKRGVLA